MTSSLGRLPLISGRTVWQIRFHDWLATRWDVLLSHPQNFTPVWPTELGEVARLRTEWDRRGVKVIGLSVDLVEAHRKWEVDIVETQDVTLDFPMTADADRRVSTLYA